MCRDTYETICTECGYRLLAWPRQQAWAQLAVEATALGDGYYSFSCHRCGASAILSYVDGTLRHHGSLAHPPEDVPQSVLDQAFAVAEGHSAIPDRSLERLRRVRESLTGAHRRQRGREQKEESDRP